MLSALDSPIELSCQNCHLDCKLSAIVVSFRNVAPIMQAIGTARETVHLYLSSMQSVEY